MKKPMPFHQKSTFLEHFLEFFLHFLLKVATWVNLVDILQKVEWTGSLYLGYPLLASADDTTLIDALLTCEEHGVIVFDFCDLVP